MENFQLLGCRVQSITRSPDGIDGLLREFIVMMLAHFLKPGDGTEQVPRLQKRQSLWPSVLCILHTLLNTALRSI
jgi:hypothetical protein